MFGFDMFGTYESRKVGRWDSEDGTKFVSTAHVTDGAHPYETAVQHPAYNNGDMVIVEAYNTIEQARAGHARWETMVEADTLPDTLVDCANSEISQVMREMDPGCMVYKRTI